MCWGGGKYTIRRGEAKKPVNVSLRQRGKATSCFVILSGAKNLVLRLEDISHFHKRDPSLAMLAQDDIND